MFCFVLSCFVTCKATERYSIKDKLELPAVSFGSLRGGEFYLNDINARYV